MSEENLEVIRRGYDLWNRGDMNGFLDGFSADATLYPLEDFSDTQIRHGRDQLRRIFSELREAWARDEVEAEELVEAGDSVVSDHLWRAVMRGTEDEVEMRVGITWLFREGEITEMRLYRSFAEALEAAGLRE